MSAAGSRPFDVDEPRGFAIAGSDRKFVNGQGARSPVPTTIEVWSDEVSEPVAVRYAWADNPVCNLYSAEGLPATPFRTDDWPGVTINNTIELDRASPSDPRSRACLESAARCPVRERGRLT